MLAYISNQPFIELSAILCIVTIISFLMRLLKQPMIIGYIFAGIIIGPVVLGLLHHSDQIETFSHVGVAILLFLVGLGLNPSIIKELGVASLMVGVGLVLFTVLIGGFLSYLLGYDLVTSVYIAIALAFSSTIIIVKLLSDKGVMDEVYGKISIGMLIVQDIIAMILLMLLSSLPQGGGEVSRLGFISLLFLKILCVSLFLYMISRYFLPYILSRVAKSQEFLLVFSLAWCLLLASLMKIIGFSYEIGALLAGLTLATLPYRFEITSKMLPLRDFFIMLFFIYLGSGLQFVDMITMMPVIIIFSIFVLIGNPLIVMIIMGYLGYKKKNSMMVGFTVAQISEFSFILIGLAMTLGHIKDPNIPTVITMVGLITIMGSSYFFSYSEWIYKHCYRFLSLFERKNNMMVETTKIHRGEKYDIFVFGNHRTGKGIVDMLQKHKKHFVIVDYDPHVIKKLVKQGYPVIYGDVSNIGTLSELGLAHASMIVSTIHDVNANVLLLQYLKSLPYTKNKLYILSASTVEDAEMLYTMGAHYVIVPHIVSGHHTAMLIERFNLDTHQYVETFLTLLKQ